jgi:hypothetical protein
LRKKEQPEERSLDLSSETNPERSALQRHQKREQDEHEGVRKIMERDEDVGEKASVLPRGRGKTKRHLKRAKWLRSDEGEESLYVDQRYPAEEEPAEHVLQRPGDVLGIFALELLWRECFLLTVPPGQQRVQGTFAKKMLHSHFCLSSKCASALCGGSSSDPLSMLPANASP